MKKPAFPKVLNLLCITVLFFAANAALGQKSPLMNISATAMGTFTQAGRVTTVDIQIASLSVPDDQRALIEAFSENGSEGLVNALEKMSSKGHIAITGTLGFDLKYIRIFKMADGSLNIRFVTDRPIRFAERWANARTVDYSLAMGEIFIKKGKNTSKGTLVPASRLTLNKDGVPELEALQNPWNLTNIHVRK